MINKKICPQCFNKKTRLASKLQYDPKDKVMFCLSCAIYYNQYVDNEKFKEVIIN